MTAPTSALPRKSSRTSTQAMAKPATELTTATAKEIQSVELERGDGLRLGDGGPEPAEPPLDRR